MKNRMNLFLSIVLIVFSTMAQDSKAKRINQYLDIAEKFGFSGQVLIDYKGEKIVNRSMGYLSNEAKIKVDDETLFGIASISKQFTAAAICHLVQQNKLTFQSTLDQFFESVTADKASITVHQLLTHTSGIRGGDLIEDYEPITKEQAIERILATELEGVPGDRWRYSNAGYNLLAFIIEEASGLSFESYLINNFFQPLEMNNTKVIGGESTWEDVKAANALNGTVDAGSPDRWRNNMRTIGGGNIASTVSDLRTWYNSLVNNTILKKKYTEQLFHPHVQVYGKEHYGYGWFVILDEDKNVKVVEHGGDYEKGFNGAFYQYRSKDVTIFILNNTYDPVAANLWQRWALFYPIRDIMIDRDPGIYADIVLGNPSSRLLGIYSDENLANSIELLASGDRYRLNFKGEELGYELYAVPDSVRKSSREATKKTRKLVDDLILENYEAYKKALKERAVVWEDFANEWRDNVKAAGRVISYEVLATIPNHYNDGVKSFVKLIHERGAYVMSFGWMEYGDGRLYGTSVYDDFQLHRYVYPDANNDLLCYDLFEDEVIRLSYIGTEIKVGEILLKRITR